MQLYEVNRSQHIMKSRTADSYADTSKGKTRYARRIFQRVNKSTSNFNKIDMNLLFGQGVLDVNILVHGETDDYTVRVSFGGILDALHAELKKTNGELNRRVIIRALVTAFDRNDIKVRCTCPDSVYRQNYYLSRNGAIAGEEETRPSDITNPNDTKGSGCKHVQMVLSNNSWITPVAAVVYNYINYMEHHYKSMYSRLIYPAIYEKDYEEPTQNTLFDTDELSSNEDELDTSNKWARSKNYIKPGWNKQAQDKTEDTEINVPGQRSFDFDSLEDEDHD